MRYFLLVAVTLFLFTPGIISQTSEQSYWEWTDLPFSAEELEGRRSKIIDILKRQDKSGLIIIPAKDGISYGETFRQLDDFYYFTGLELPNALLVMNIDSEQSTIYAPQTDMRFESGSRPNDFPGRPLASSFINCYTPEFPVGSIFG